MHMILPHSMTSKMSQQKTALHNYLIPDAVRGRYCTIRYS